MAQKVVRVDEDLADPESLATTKMDPAEHRWRMFRAVAIFCAYYSLLHKVLIPFVLSWTHLKQSPYAHIDFAFVLNLSVLAFFYRNKAALGRFGSFLLASLISHAVVLIGEIYFLEVPGWLSFSHLLSSVPMGVASILLLTQAGTQRKDLYAWAGALFGLILSLFLIAGPSREIQKGISDTLITQDKVPSPTQSVCGVQELLWKSELAQENTYLSIFPCGLSPSQMIWTRKLQVKNETTSLVNLRLVLLRPGYERRLWNAPLLPGVTLDKELPFISSDEALVVLSDVQPKMGLLIIQKQDSLRSFWVRRLPWAWGVQE